MSDKPRVIPMVTPHVVRAPDLVLPAALAVSGLVFAAIPLVASSGDGSGISGAMLEVLFWPIAFLVGVTGIILFVKRLMYRMF